MFHTEPGALFLVWISIGAVVASFAVVVFNVISPLSLRFNLAWLGVMCAFGAFSIANFYDWI